MDTQKIVIVILILIIVIFVIFVTRGSLTGDQPKRRDSSQSKKAVETVETPDWSKTINKIFGDLQESVSLECEVKSPPKSDRKCEELPRENIIKAAKEPSLPLLKKTTFRTLKLVLVKGQATIVYTDKKGGSNIDNPQTFDLPNPKNNNSIAESLVIMEDGGILNISCRGNDSCQVGVQ